MDMIEGILLSEDGVETIPMVKSVHPGMVLFETMAPMSLTPGDVFQFPARLNLCGHCGRLETQCQCDQAEI